MLNELASHEDRSGHTKLDESMIERRTMLMFGKILNKADVLFSTEVFSQFIERDASSIGDSVIITHTVKILNCYQ